MYFFKKKCMQWSMYNLLLNQTYITTNANPVLSFYTAGRVGFGTWPRHTWHEQHHRIEAAAPSQAQGPPPKTG